MTCISSFDMWLVPSETKTRFRSRQVPPYPAAMTEKKPAVDYSLYLVTGRDLLPEGKAGDRAPRAHTSIDVLSVGLLGVPGRGEAACKEYADLYSDRPFVVD